MLEKEKLADLWVEHSNKMWRTVYATPVIAVAVIAGWYGLLSKSEESTYLQAVGLPLLVLLVGIIVLFVHWAVISRMAQFDAALFRAVENDLPNIGRPALGISGRWLAQLVPLLMIAVLVLLFVFTLTFSAEQVYGDQ